MFDSAAAPTEQVESMAVAGPGEVHARPAALWRRLIAFLVDTALQLALLSGFLWVAAKVAHLPPPPAHAVGLDLLALTLHAWSSILVPGAVLAVVLGFVYTAVFGFVWRGRTPGRFVAGIRLVDPHGRTPGPRRAVLRAVISLVSFAFLLAGFWWGLFDRKGQTLHDKLTRTWPVRPTD